MRYKRKWIKLDGMPESKRQALERQQAHDLAVFHALVPPPSRSTTGNQKRTSNAA
jgi:hypothetical protein